MNVYDLTSTIELMVNDFDLKTGFCGEECVVM